MDSSTKVTSCALVGYSNSNYVADLDARRSMTSYAFTIGNFLVSCKATLKPTTALSKKEENISGFGKSNEGRYLVKGSYQQSLASLG